MDINSIKNIRFDCAKCENYVLIPLASRGMARLNECPHCHEPFSFLFPDMVDVLGEAIGFFQKTTGHEPGKISITLKN